MAKENWMERSEVKGGVIVPDDGELVRRALAQDPNAFRYIMQRHNRRLYRIARSVLRDNTDAEDVVQKAYVSAFSHLATYRGESGLAVWLARIALNEALARLQHKRGEFAGPGQANEGAVIQFPLSAQNENPERTMAQRQITQLVERAADALPDAYRLVFVTHVVEGMSVEETAELLGIEPETVKTRLHRARQLLRDQLDKQIGPALKNAFPFAGRRRQRVTAAVLTRFGLAE
jgi:RNA polymerase sigma-70 factor, ECF subfamily